MIFQEIEQNAVFVHKWTLVKLLGEMPQNMQVYLTLLSSA